MCTLELVKDSGLVEELKEEVLILGIYIRQQVHAILYTARQLSETCLKLPVPVLALANLFSSDPGVVYCSCCAGLLPTSSLR